MNRRGFWAELVLLAALIVLATLAAAEFGFDPLGIMVARLSEVRQ